MSLWYGLCNLLPLEMLHWDFMKNAFLAMVLMAPLFGLLSTMIVTGRMSFFLGQIKAFGFIRLFYGHFTFQGTFSHFCTDVC